MANAASAGPKPRRVDFDPLLWIWRLLTSVRFALFLIGFLLFVSLVGIVIPQLPIELRQSPAATEAWLALQREENFGVLTDLLYDLGLFEIFRNPSSGHFGFAGAVFLGGLLLLVASVCVCTVNRFVPIWRNISRPQTRVPDDYFERGQQVIDVAAPNPDSLIRQLRRRRYRVVTTEGDGTIYLFADRFSWAQMATFISHLALILFLAGGLVTLATSREQQIFVAEGEAGGAPVFAPTDSDHMQVVVEDAVGTFDDSGFPLDFRTKLVVYQGGLEVARGVTTVNDPLEYGGFRFHQSAYFPDGVALRVRDLDSGRVVYDEVLALISEAATPRVQVRNSNGDLLLDDLIVPTDFIGDAAGTLLTVPGTGQQFWVGAQQLQSPETWQLIVLETSDQDGARAVIEEGSEAKLGSLIFRFAGLSTIPSTAVAGLPGAAGQSVLELSDGPRGPLLTIGPISGRALALSPEEPVALGRYEYTFLGRREFSGITVRRDPGSTVIWIATGLFLVGLMLTFYTPRRRLWGKITSGKAVFRGLGGRVKAIEGEVRQAAAAASEEPRNE